MIHWTPIKTDVVLSIERTSTQTRPARVTWRLRHRPMNKRPKISGHV